MQQQQGSDFSETPVHVLTLTAVSWQELFCRCSHIFQLAVSQLSWPGRSGSPDPQEMRNLLIQRRELTNRADIPTLSSHGLPSPAIGIYYVSHICFIHSLVSLNLPGQRHTNTIPCVLFRSPDPAASPAWDLLPT